MSQIETIKSANDASLFFKSTLIDIFQKHDPEFDKKKSELNLAQDIKIKMIDRDRLLRKMRKTKLENDISAYIK